MSDDNLKKSKTGTFEIGKFPLENNLSSEATDVEIQFYECDDVIDFEGLSIEPRIFKTSDMEQPAELTAYLEEVTNDPFNHYCLNCKQSQSTHVMLWLGAFICENCKPHFLLNCGGNQQCYIKSIFNEHWDDYQLRSIAFGGNRNVFNVLLENQIEKTPMVLNYNHAAVKSYRQKLMNKMDGVSPADS